MTRPHLRTPALGPEPSAPGQGGFWNSVLAVALILLAAPPVSAATVDRIVAVVNDEVITESDISSHADVWLKRSDVPLPPEGADLNAVRAAVLRQLIEQRLILQEAKRLGVSVEAEDVLGRLDELRRQAGSEDAFQRSLAESGLSVEQLKEKLREQIAVQRVIDAKVRSAVTVSPLDVAQGLRDHPELDHSGADRIRVAHLLVRVSEGRSEAEARSLIEELHHRAASGEPFEALAARYSEDPHREAGGDMGWVAPGELLPELDAALSQLDAGACSEPIRTRLGFHLLKVRERRSASSLSLAEAHRAVYQQLYQQRFRDALTRWLEDLKRHAYIKLMGDAW